jgi:hypothetical protein
MVLRDARICPWSCNGGCPPCGLEQLHLPNGLLSSQWCAASFLFLSSQSRFFLPSLCICANGLTRLSTLHTLLLLTVPPPSIFLIIFVPIVLQLPIWTAKGQCSEFLLLHAQCSHVNHNQAYHPDFLGQTLFCVRSIKCFTNWQVALKARHLRKESWLLHAGGGAQGVWT